MQTTPQYASDSRTSTPSTRRKVLALTLAGLTSAASVGCSSFWGGKSDDPTDSAFKQLMTVPKTPELIRDAAVSRGLHLVQVDGIGAVVKLAGTGGPADPSQFRDELIEEMKRQNVRQPNRFLESKENALVRVRAVIPPGARRGDPIDIKVLAPEESNVSDLRGGWMLDTRLRQQLRLKKRMMRSSVRSGEVLAIGAGPVVTRAAHTIGDDVTSRVEGNIISGGRVQKDRNLSLVLRPEFKHVHTATQISDAINHRFFFFDGETRRGIAKPKEDDYIEIDLHPRYRHNPFRMMEVIKAIGVEKESSKTQSRLARLAAELSDPATAANAALELEGLGESAVPMLIDALSHQDPELVFYAAESLAYLDRDEAIEPLIESARDVAAFRAPALLALQTLKQPQTVAAMMRLFNSESLETRYGAFASIRRRTDGKRALAGKSLGAYWLYKVSSTAKPTIAISLRESPEIVQFGSPDKIQLASFLRGPGGILIRPNTSSGGSGLKISRYETGKEDKHAESTTEIASLIEALSSVDASYGDVIEILRALQEKKAINAQVAIDPLPRSMRTYHRDVKSSIDQNPGTAPE